MRPNMSIKMETRQPTVVEEDDVIKVTFGGDTSDEEDECEDDGQTSARSGDNIWTVGENALRDLLVYLVRKHRVDEVYDSKVKARNWDELTREFVERTGSGAVSMPKAQIMRKWHNWKQYNKQHSKPHPFVVSGETSLDSILRRVAKLLSDARKSPCLNRFLRKGGNEPFVDKHLDGEREEAVDENDDEPKRPDDRLKRLRDRDFTVNRTGATASSLSVRKLEHEIALESFNYERQRWKVKVDNGRLLQRKLQKELELADLKLERAKCELQTKRRQMASLGITVPPPPPPPPPPF